MARIHLMAAAAAALLSAGTPAAHAGDSAAEQRLADSRQTAQRFLQTLGSALKAQLEAGGPVAAIGVCKEIAPALAREYSRDGRVVRRVSLKPRNAELGVPDALEAKKLAEFEGALAAGTPAQALEFSAVTAERDGRWYRYMKAIPTQDLCLQCHGAPSQIAPEVRALLAREYPRDQATGYRAGQLRGALTIKTRLDPH